MKQIPKSMDVIESSMELKFKIASLKFIKQALVIHFHFSGHSIKTVAVLTLLVCLAKERIFRGNYRPGTGACVKY